MILVPKHLHYVLVLSVLNVPISCIFFIFFILMFFPGQVMIGHILNL